MLYNPPNLAAARLMPTAQHFHVAGDRNEPALGLSTGVNTRKAPFHSDGHSV